jgi:predicted dienelactone hydrolase
MLTTFFASRPCERVAITSQNGLWLLVDNDFSTNKLDVERGEKTNTFLLSEIHTLPQIKDNIAKEETIKLSPKFYIQSMKKLHLWFLVSILVPVYLFGQPHNVGEKSYEFTDISRNRPVKVEMWYPTNETDQTGERKTNLPFILIPTIRDAKFINKKLPLVILSHGSGGNRFSLAWLAIALAKQGYVVAAPDHWGGTFGNMVPAYYIRYWERPLDISFVLTTLLADTSLSSLIDPESIGVAGYSFGGYTSLALAGADIDCSILKKNAKTPQGKKEFYNPELGDLRKIIDTLSCNITKTTFKDTRIKAFVALAPGLGLGFETKEQTKNVNAPVLIIAAANDQVAPINTNAALYHTLIPLSKYIVLQEKTSHYVFLNEGSESLKKEAKQLFTDDKTISRNTIHNTIGSEVINFFEQTLKK